jgi:hypothetical protein
MTLLLLTIIGIILIGPTLKRFFLGACDDVSGPLMFLVYAVMFLGTFHGHLVEIRTLDPTYDDTIPLLTMSFLFLYLAMKIPLEFKRKE